MTDNNMLVGWFGKHGRLSLIAVGIAVAFVVVWQAYSISAGTAVSTLRETGGERLNLYASTLRGALEKFRYLPFVLSRNKDIVGLLDGHVRPDQVSHYLEAVNAKAGSAVLYVMDAAGETISSSNWRDPLSFVGRNYAFRPYFIEAASGRPGGFFAIGVTTGRPGYFMSFPIYDGDRVVGVAVVKVDLDPLQTAWMEGGETVLVSDSNGIVVLSSRPEWKYRSLEHLSPVVLEEVHAGKQYHGVDLQPLSIQKPWASKVDSVVIDDEPFLMQSRAVKELNWRIHFLSRLETVRDKVYGTVAMTTVSAFLLIAILLYFRERRLKHLSRQQAREAEKFRDLNAKLQDEIAERGRTEQELRDAQEDLIQAGKLAALGQMSAAIAHELNQPLAAIRTFIASTRKFVERGETNRVVENLGTVSGLTERMASITTQLKTFARKSEGKNQTVVLQESLSHTLTLLEGQIKLEEVEIDLAIDEIAVAINGDPVRVEQVLINLIRNALDAMRESKTKRLSISLGRIDEWARIAISDTGHGIPTKSMAQLFDPFFTTKEVGEGVGLGLSISYGIIVDMGGTVRGQNNDREGATFIVRLPLSGEGT